MNLDTICEFYDIGREKLDELVSSVSNFARYDHSCVVRDATLVYGDESKVKSAILKFPAFVGYDHSRVVRDATLVYGDESKVKTVIMKHPQFAGKNHSRVVRDATLVYGDESKVKTVIMKYPQFAGLKHPRVVCEATLVYGNESEVKSAIMKHPGFAGYNHSRVVRDATSVYGDESKVKSAILKFPPFAGLNHPKKLKQKCKIGIIIGYPRDDVINYILENPINTGYSFKRDLARIDVARQLSNEGFDINSEVRDIFLRNYIYSPYSKDTRLRYSKAVKKGLPEPKLLTVMRRRLERIKERKEEELIK